VTDQSWRKAWALSLEVLISTPITVLLMSATLPPQHLHELWATLTMTGSEPFVRIIRAPHTQVLNISHQILYQNLHPQHHSPKPKELVYQTKPIVRYLQSQLMDPKDCLIIFCNKKANAVALAKEFSTLPAITGETSVDHRLEAFGLFTSSAELDLCARSLVMNKAGFYGFNYPHVKIVLHLETPHNMVDYVQASGRGGRNPEMQGALSLTVLPGTKSYYERLPPLPLDFSGKNAIREMFFEPECFRIPQSIHLDGQALSCIELRREHQAGPFSNALMLCGACISRQLRSAPNSLSFIERMGLRGPFCLSNHSARFFWIGAQKFTSFSLFHQQLHFSQR